MATYAGFDSAEYRKLFQFRGRQHATRGLIGIGVKSSDIAKTKKAYAAAMKALFDRYGLKQERPAYCAAELAAIFGTANTDKEKEALTGFLAQMLPSIDEIHFFYTYLFHIKAVTIFGADTDGYAKIPVSSQKKGEMDFYDLINPAYTMLCAWKYSFNASKDVLLLDNFQGRVCPAWDEFSQTTNPDLHYNGDRCNALISTADLLVRLVKLRMLENNCRFLEAEMNLLPEAGKKFTKHFLGTYYLKKMAPHKRTRIKTQRFAHHPIYCVIRESPKEEGEREMVESTPKFQKLLAMAFDKDACVKFFDEGEDARMLTKEDGIYTYGERGKKIMKSLKALGKEVQDISEAV